eukprot:gene22683-biopygen31348
MSDRTSGLTPLHYAASDGNVQCIMALLGDGAGVNVKDGSGSTPLHKAVVCGNVECITALLDHGADVNVNDGRGRTPLHEAVLGAEYINKLPDRVVDSGAA